MKRFEMEAGIVLESNEQIAEALENIAKNIRNGSNCGSIPGEIQCAYWGIDENNDED